MDKRQRFDELDGYRGIAALCVVAFHVYMAPRIPYGWPAPDRNPWRVLFLGNLDLAVAWFFVLSGFVVTLPLVRACLAQSSRPSPRAFLTRRAWRILPLYYTILVAVWLGGWPGRPGAPMHDARALVEHLLFWQLASGSRVFAIVGPAWSLACEVAYYLAVALAVVPLYALCTRRRTPQLRAAALALALVPVFVVAAGARALPGAPAWLWPVQYADTFALGVGLALIVALGWRLPARLAGYVRLAGVAVMLAALPLRTLAPFAATNAYLLAGGGFVLLMASTVLTPAPSLWARAASVAPLRRLGAVSYGLYLWHQPLQFALIGHGWLGRTPATMLRDGVVLTALALAVATVTYLAVERPALRWRATGRARNAGSGSAWPAPPREMWSRFARWSDSPAPDRS